MPPGHRHDDRAVRLEARVEILVEPFPDAVAVALAIRFLPALERVIEEDEASRQSRDARTNPDRAHAPAFGRFPIFGRVLLLRELDPAPGEPPNLPRDFLRELVVIGGD